MTPRYCCASAFSLVELSIVLVIVGLIIGGVLVGQDMIRNAGLRSEISDLEKYNAAATTFNAKYGGLPGDLALSRAVQYQFSSTGDTNATGMVGYRDGNGVIEGGAAGATNLVGETALFWQDLSKAGFIGGSYIAAGTTNTTGANVTHATINQYLPKTRFRENVSHYLYSDTGRNYYYLAAFTTDASAVMTPTGAVSPLEGKGIDEKMDDGSPSSGIVVSMSNFTTLDPGAAAASTVCTTNTTPQVYNVISGATGAPDNPVCQLRIRSSF